MRAHPAGPLHADVLAQASTAGPRPSTSDELNDLPAAVWPRGATRSGTGVVTFAGLDVRDLTEQYGTPHCEQRPACTSASGTG